MTTIEIFINLSSGFMKGKKMKKKVIFLILLAVSISVIYFTEVKENENIAENASGTITSIDELLSFSKESPYFEPEKISDVINNIKDWESLGLSKTDVRYICLNAFINGDTATLAELNSLPSEAYNAYKTIKLGEYTITADVNCEVIFNVNIMTSSIDYYSVGYHSFIAYEGIDGVYIRNPEIEDKAKGNTTAREALNRWFQTCGTYEFYDYKSLDGELFEQYSYWITDYLQLTFGYDKTWTFEKIQRYAEQYFGIANFIPLEHMLTEERVYEVGGHGGDVWFYKYTDEKAENGITTLTIQFYADTPMTIESHTVEYRLQEVDGFFKILSSEIIQKSPYEPKHYQL